MVAEGQPATEDHEARPSRLEAAKAGNEGAGTQAAQPRSSPLPGVMFIQTSAGSVRVPVSGLAVGRTPVVVRVEVRGARISRVMSAAVGQPLPEGLAAALAGSPVPGIGDGEYMARLERAPRPR